MIVRTFTGPSVREVLNRVRDAFGADAVILETHVNDRVAGRGLVRVTAAAEPTAAPSDTATNEGPKSLHVTGELAATGDTPAVLTAAPESTAIDSPSGPSSPPEAWRATLRRLTDAVTTLRHHGGDDPVWLLLRQWLATQSTLAGEITEAFAAHLTESLPPADPFLDTRPHGVVVLFVGSRGAGRSTALFRALASRWRTSGRQPRLAVISESLDHGQERLAACCDRGGVEFVPGQVSDPRVWRALRHDRRDDLFVEYVPNARNGSLESIAKIVRRGLKPDVVVQVLAATGSSQFWRHDCRRFSPFRTSHLLITRWDEMQPWWAVFNTARESGLLPAYRASGIDPIDGLEPFTATDLRTGLAEHLSWEIRPSGAADRRQGGSR